MYIIKTIEEVRYNNPYFWNKDINPLATIENCLPNCVCCACGLLASAKLPQMVDRWTNARELHKHLINGWIAVPYAEYKNYIKVGDAIEWCNGNHVAVVSSTSDGIWISGSFYTGIHGTATYGGDYDTRDGIGSLKDADAFFFNNYAYRYFHYVSLDTENRWCGSEPDYVLVAPNSINPVSRDTTKDQIYVGTTGLRVRSEPNTTSQINGTAKIGYYNISEIVVGGDFEGGNTWYKVEDFYLASVEGVQYFKKEEIAPIEEMMALIKQMESSYFAVCKERDIYKEKIDKIRGIVDE